MRYMNIAIYIYINCDHISNQTLQTCITVGVSVNINVLSSPSYYMIAIFEFTITRGKINT